MRLANWIAVALLAPCVIGVSRARAAEQPLAKSPPPPMCGPFGDPPATVTYSPKPGCKGGKLMGPWNDANNTPRYACLYEPSGVSPQKPLPLVVFLHGTGGSADWVATGFGRLDLLKYLNSANVSDDPTRPGFILISGQGRKISFPFNYPLNNKTQWDVYYRQYSPNGGAMVGGTLYPENVDAATIDQFISEEVATGKVDTNRIYVMGWSIGSAMTYLYGLNRPNIAAISPYAGYNPFFYGPGGGSFDPCQQVPVRGEPANPWQVQIFNSALSIYQTKNDCDLGLACASSEILAGELEELGSSVQDVIINGPQKQVSQCDFTCNDIVSPASGAAGMGGTNHGRWPTSWTAQMLDFLRRHPLPH